MNAIKTTEGTEKENLMHQVLDGAYVQVLNGFGVFPSAHEVAQEYLVKNPDNVRRAAEELILWQTTKAATSGFLTNLGGVATLPISIPANISSVLYVQIRMIAAIAIMGGHDIQSDKVRTIIYTSLLGAAATDILKDAGINLGTRLTRTAIQGITQTVATKMATSTVARLLAKLGLASAGNFAKLIPLAGGIIGAAIDATATQAVGAIALKIFLGEAETTVKELPQPSP